MRDFRTFTVAPKMPENLAFLQELANNVWWSWNIDASALFRRMSPALFREVQYNPIALLAKIGQERLEELSLDRIRLCGDQAVPLIRKDTDIPLKPQKPSDPAQGCRAI